MNGSPDDTKPMPEEGRTDIPADQRQAPLGTWPESLDTPTAAPPSSYQANIAATGAASARHRTRRLWIIVALLIGAQLAVAAVMISRRRTEAPPATPAVVANEPPEATALPTQQKAPDALSYYTEAKKLAAEGKYLEAMDAIARIRAMVQDEDLRNLVDKLEQRIRITPRLEEASKLIDEGKYEAAIYHLDGLLTRFPSNKDLLALRLKAQRLAGRAAGATASTPATRRAAAAAHARKSWRHAATRRTRRAIPVPPSAELTVRSKPTSMVQIDDHSEGLTPLLALKLAPGKHVVALNRTGMQPYNKDLILSAGEKRTLDVELAPAQPVEPIVRAAPVPATVIPPAIPEKREPTAKLSTTTPAEKTAIAPAPRMPAEKPPVEPRSAIPTLSLPKRIKVPVYRTDRMGVAMRSLPMVRTVCRAVEQTVTQAIGRTANGTTKDLQTFIYEQYKGSDQQTITLYPQTMGYMVAQALLKGEHGIGAKLLQQHRSGHIARLASANWKP